MIRKSLAIAAVALAGALAAPQAEAGHSRSSLSITIRTGYASCGCPTYSRRYFRGYDYYRRPVYHYSRLPFHHGSSCRHRAVHRGYRSHRPYVYTRSGFAYRPRVAIHGRSYGRRGHSRGYHRGGRCR